MKKLFTLAVLFIVVNALGQGQFQKEVAGSMAFASGQVMQLAAAIPADKYDYTPQEGVRNVAQVCAHIVSANYFFASKLGAKIPEGTTTVARQEIVTVLGSKQIQIETNLAAHADIRDVGEELRVVTRPARHDHGLVAQFV